MRIHNWQFLFVPSIAFAIGFLSNALVMAFNHGQMPVLIPGGRADIMDPDDFIHCAMTAQTHLRFLSDWIVIRGFGIASPGDFGVWFWRATFIPGLAIWVWSAIERQNKIVGASWRHYNRSK